VPYKIPKYRIGEKFRMTGSVMKARKKVAPERKQSVENQSRTIACSRLESKKPVLRFEERAACGFLDRNSIFLGRVMGNVNKWNKTGVPTTDIKILTIISVGGQHTVSERKIAGPVFFEDAINSVNSSTTVQTTNRLI
jgi:hypothetical protein